MKNFLLKCTINPLLFICCLLIPATHIVSQGFQKVYGNAFNNAGWKVVPHGLNYYIIGSNQPSAGALSRGSISYINQSGELQWTRTLAVSSVLMDGVLTPGGDLMVVGNTLPAGVSTAGIIGSIDQTGNFNWLNVYDQPGAESLWRIVKSPSPINAAFPYLVAGTQADSSENAIEDDAVLLALNELGIISYKKVLIMQGDNELTHDMEVMPNGDIILVGSWGPGGSILWLNKAAEQVTAASPEVPSYKFTDIALASDGGFYAVGGTPSEFYLSKLTDELLNVYDVEIENLTSITQVWEDSNTGEVYVVGIGTFQGKSRAVVMNFADEGDEISLNWLKYLDDGESTFTGGSIWFLPPDWLAFTDGRVQPNGGFGGENMFLSVSDLSMTSCLTLENAVNVQLDTWLYNGPSIEPFLFWDVPQATPLSSSFVTWQEQDLCAVETCFAEFEFEINCGIVSFFDLSSIPNIPSWIWTFEDGFPATSTAQNPVVNFPGCGTYEVCLTVTGSSGLTSCSQTICKNVNISDNIPPVIHNCPANISIQGVLGGNGNCTANVTIISPTTSDNCESPVTLVNNYNQTANASGLYPSGTTTVIWTATDKCGNTATCLFTVNVSCESNPEALIKCGMAVTTYSVFSNSSGKVISVRDVRNFCPQPQLTNWLAPEISLPGWSLAQLGEIFGIATDASNNIFVCATSAYTQSWPNNSPYGPAGSGGIYKIDAINGAVTQFVTTASCCGSTIGTNTIPNDRAGLGNIAYDKINNKFFVTNLEDGKIYRIHAGTGIVEATYDPFLPDNGITGISCQGERIWGIGLYGTKLYFSQCNQNQTTGVGPNKIYSLSIGLNGSFPTAGSELLEITIPPISTQYNYSTPVSDIEFAHDGTMLLAEHTEGGQSCTPTVNAHASRVLKYLGAPGILNLSTDQYFLGVPNHRNSAGGVDFGYACFDPLQEPIGKCDEIVWASADALILAPPVYVYGLAGIPVGGNTASALNSWFVDDDSDLKPGDKKYIGDVDIIDCGCQPEGSVCDSISIASSNSSSPSDSCCFELTVQNFKPNYFTGIAICSQNGVSISSIAAQNGWSITGYSANMVTLAPPISTIPITNQNFLKFCLSNYQNVPSQQIIVKYYGPDFDVVCMDTLNYQCSQKPKCLMVVNDIVTCGPNGTYNLDFCVQANMLIPFATTSFTLNSPSSNFTFTPNVFQLNPALAAGQSRCTFSTQISGALDGQQICFSVTAHKQNILNGEAPLDCCTDTVMQICATMPACVCNNVSASAVQVPSNTDSCCWKISLTNNYSNSYFKGVKLDILTSGVYFGAIKNTLGSGWNMVYSPFQATLTKIPPVSYIGATSMLPDICLSGINSSAQVPQYIKVSWLDANGQMVCMDTLELDCNPPVKVPCAELKHDKIICSDISGVYDFTFQVKNNTGFTATQVVLNNLNPLLSIAPNSFTISPLASGSTSSVLSASIFGIPGSTICFNLTLHEQSNDTIELNCCTNSDPYCFVLPVCDSCFCTENTLPKPNLVANGNFSSGDQYFTSGLTGPVPGNSCRCASGTYCVDQNFTDKCSGWPSVMDHTGNPGGKFLIVDGNANVPVTIWSQPVTLVPCMDYCFSFWTASVYPQSLQEFDLNVLVTDANGSLSIGLVHVVQSTSGNPWVNHSLSWTAPCNASGPFILSIRQISGDSYLDFGIDDICFTKSELELDTCCKDEKAFNNLVAQGFSITQNGCEVTVCSKQFNDCHFFGTEPSFGDGMTVPAVQVAANGCWTHTYTQSGTYNICATVYEDTCWSKTMCIPVNVVCDPTGCTCPVDGLVINPGLENGISGKPDNSDQIGLATNWAASTNLAGITSNGDWYSNSNPAYPGFFFDELNLIYRPLSAHCGLKYAGFDPSTCEGIGTHFSPAMIPGQTYSISFWWSPKEPITTTRTFIAVLSGQSCKVNLSNGACTHICGGDIHIPVSIGPGNKPGTWYPITATGIVPNPGTAPFTINYISFMGALGQTPISDQYIFIDDVCAVATAPVTCNCALPNQLSFVDSKGQIPINPLIVIPATLVCDNLPKATFYYHGNAHCFSDSCISNDFTWVITEPSSGSVLSGTQSFSVVNAPKNEAHFDVQVPYSALSPSVIYTMTIIYNCGGKACQFSANFIIECETCICGPLVDISWRPNQGGPDINIHCGDSLTLGCLPATSNVSFNGNFSCLGNNCSSAYIHWELRQPGVLNPIDFGVLHVNGFFTLPLPSAYFANPGAYELYWYGECAGRICVGCEFIITSLGCPCKCDRFDQIKLVNKRLGVNQSIACGNKSAIPIQCPAPGQPYKVTGKLNCDPVSCKPSILHWELKQGATLVGSGNQTGPWYSVSLDHTLMTGLTGLYDLVLTGMCGSDSCVCVLKFDISGCPMASPCPCETQAEKDAFFNAVTSGFTYVYDYQGDCAILINANVDNCDHVQWKLEGINTGNTINGSTQGSQIIRVVFPNNIIDTYKATMTVTRPGTTCSLTYCSYININCIIVGMPAIICEDNLVGNSGFNINTWPGILGHGGNTEGWIARAGLPELWDGDGCEDSYSISIVGQCSPIGVDIIDYPVFIDDTKDGYKFSACYWNSSEDVKPGTHLVIRLSDEPQETAMCTGECIEVARIPIEVSSGDEWRTISTSQLRQEVSGLKYLTLHLENDLAYDVPDANSKIMLDNICFEQNNFTTVPTSEIADFNKAVRLYPNPNTGQFILEFNAAAADNIYIRVFSLTGQIVYEKQPEPGKVKQAIDLSALSSGMYYVQVMTQGQILSTDRFVKQ